MRNDADQAISERLHRAVVLARRGLPPSDDHTQVRRLDGDKLNVHVSNLVWGTARENYDDVIRHGSQCGLRYVSTPEQRAELPGSKEPTGVLAERYGVGKSTIERAKAGTSRRKKLAA